MSKWIFSFILLASLPGYSQPRLPENYFWQKMDNGLEVVVIENNKVPLATIEMAVKNGAYTEGPEFSGLSHLFEHMFFKANNDYPDQEKFIRRTEELGMIWNGTTGEERVNYYFTFNNDSLEAGLKFMNAAMRFPIYRKEDMAKENPVVDGPSECSIQKIHGKYNLGVYGQSCKSDPGLVCTNCQSASGFNGKADQEELTNWRIADYGLKEYENTPGKPGVFSYSHLHNFVFVDYPWG